jgi:DNA-binding winged helix-turn-helix (wHTH) protein
MDHSFYIDNQFLIEPSLNTVTDQASGKLTRLEPRLMQLLCTLTERQQKMVTREELVTTIWQDYGGGDDGLTQAISILRKTLLDDKKQLIQTVPKKGYIFRGSVSHNADIKETTGERKNYLLSFPKRWVLIISTAIFLVIVLLYIKNHSGKNTSTKPTEVPYPVNAEQEEGLEENKTNTITTRAAGDTIYKLVMIGDRPPKFYINNQRILEDKWDPYMTLINSLKRQLIQRRK